MRYKPTPINTQRVRLSKDLRQLLESLAKNAHEVWARARMRDGWSWGPERNDSAKKHLCLVPYEDLPQSEKEYDRQLASETIKVILALGYKIKKESPENR
jgi:RyR domain